MMNSKELALKQIEKARENLNLAYKLLDYPEEIEIYLDDVDAALDNVKYEIKKMNYLNQKPKTQRTGKLMK